MSDGDEARAQLQEKLEQARRLSQQVLSYCRFDGHQVWVFQKPEVGYGMAQIQSRVQDRGG
jgi:hypothetical protein